LGSLATFSTTASGTSPFNYLWRKNGIVIPHQTNSELKILSVNVTDAGLYTVEVTGGCGTASCNASLAIAAEDLNLRISGLRTVHNDVVVGFTSLPDRYYRLQFSDKLSPAQWRTAADYILGTGGIVQAVDVGGAVQGRRFYRVQLLSNVDLAPAVSFRANTTLGPSPLAVTFTDTSSGLLTNRFWDFGDGHTTNTTATSVTHVYTVPATNTVTLTVIGSLGVDSLTRVNYIAVTDQLVITAIEVAGPDTLIHFTSKAGKYYRVLYTESLSNPVWRTAADYVLGTGGIVQAVDVGGAVQGERYYRIRQLP